MATRVKQSAAVAVPQNREDVQQWIAALGNAQRKREELRGAMNAQIGPITERFAPDIDAQTLEEARLLDGIATWCEANKADLTKESKTVNLITGEVSWRMNPPSVAFKRGIKVDEIIAHIKQLKLAKLFVRTKEEVDKEAILKADEKTQDKLCAAGTIKVIKDAETFSVTPFEQSAS
jgi:phage host-nuclease inhibitor protein Gam